MTKRYYIFQLRRHIQVPFHTYIRTGKYLSFHDTKEEAEEKIKSLDHPYPLEVVELWVNEIYSEDHV